MSGLIEPGFMFSQHSLATFVQCPRRFAYKYIDRQPWPQVDKEQPLAYEENLERGRVFHQWIARDLLGVDGQAIIADCQDEDLLRWWGAYEGFDLDALPGEIREVELPVVVALGDYRLYARYDLLAMERGGDAVVVDWKTLQKTPSARTLQDRMQTRVYLYTTVAAGSVLTGGPPVVPERTTMLYWFANLSESHEVGYNQRQFQKDGRELAELAKTIAAMPREAFTPTEDTRLCAYCNYRTLCHDDLLAGDGDRDAWLDEDLDTAIDLASVPAIDF